MYLHSRQTCFFLFKIAWKNCIKLLNDRYFISLSSIILLIEITLFVLYLIVDPYSGDTDIAKTLAGFV